MNSQPEKNVGLCRQGSCAPCQLETDTFLWLRMDSPNNVNFRLCKRDVAQVCAALQKAKIDDERVRLLCIAAELEAFLIADERALSKRLGSNTRRADCPRKQNPHRLADPKNDLDSIFRDHGRVYSAPTDALKIAQLLEDFNRLNKIPSFKRLTRLVSETDFACSRI